MKKISKEDEMLGDILKRSGFESPSDGFVAKFSERTFLRDSAVLVFATPMFPKKIKWFAIVGLLILFGIIAIFANLGYHDDGSKANMIFQAEELTTFFQILSSNDLFYVVPFVLLSLFALLILDLIAEKMLRAEKTKFK